MTTVPAVNAVGFDAGYYEQVSTSAGSATCPNSVSIQKPGEFPDASDISLDDVRCSDGQVSVLEYMDELPSELGQYVSKFFAGFVTSELVCGDVQISHFAEVYIIRFRIADASLKEVLVRENVDQLKTFDPDKIEKGIDYIGTEDGCWYKWTAATSSGSPSTTESGSGSSPNFGPGSKTDSSNECFPAHALVRLQDGRITPMSKLRTGNIVQVGADRYSPIFSWTHTSPTAISTFVIIWHALGTMPLSVTPNHFVYKSDGSTILSRYLVVGDELLIANGTASVITKVETVTHRGLYNPQTLHGDIVVDGVRTSTYTLAVPPKTAHALLSPMRAAFNFFDAVIGIASPSSQWCMDCDNQPLSSS